MSNVRPGRTLDLVIDDAYCATGKQTIRLDEFKSPTLESRATLYPKDADKKYGTIVLDCDELRSHYRKYFNIPEPPVRVNYEPPEEPRPIGWDDDGDNDHWGDEYLEIEGDEPEDYRPEKASAAEQYFAWKLNILSLIRGRFERIEHARDKGK